VEVKAADSLTMTFAYYFMFISEKAEAGRPSTRKWPGQYGTRKTPDRHGQRDQGTAALGQGRASWRLSRRSVRTFCASMRGQGDAGFN
jgi:hypothetical protein